MKREYTGRVCGEMTNVVADYNPVHRVDGHTSTQETVVKRVVHFAQDTRLRPLRMRHAVYCASVQKDDDAQGVEVNRMSTQDVHRRPRTVKASQQGVFLNAPPYEKRGGGNRQKRRHQTADEVRMMDWKVLR